MINKDSGLNIFLSAKVSELPPGLLSLNPDQQNKTLCLVGSGGKLLWEKLSHPINVKEHPLDQYTIKRMQEFADESLEGDIEILYPNDNYQLPLQKIGRFFNLCEQSPIGLDISEEFGLWFAFRGVFLTSKDVSSPKIDSPPTLCKTCIPRPCLLTSDLNLARLSCPVRPEHRYGQEQRDFHQSVLNILKV